jgi:hypothetical protein
MIGKTDNSPIKKYNSFVVYNSTLFSLYSHSKSLGRERFWWLMPVILNTQEVEIRRMEF